MTKHGGQTSLSKGGRKPGADCGGSGPGTVARAFALPRSAGLSYLCRPGVRLTPQEVKHVAEHPQHGPGPARHPGARRCCKEVDQSSQILGAGFDRGDNSGMFADQPRGLPRLGNDTDTVLLVFLVSRP